MQKTYSAKPGEVERRWFVVDVEGQVLGRIATEIATILRGKHKPQFTPHTDTGDFVIAVNADKIKLTGSKLDKKSYYRHSGFIGNLKSISAAEQLRRHPERVLHAAVAGMLPKNTLGRNQLKKLKIYAGPEHPHQAQVPAPLELAREQTARDQADRKQAASDQADKDQAAANQVAADQAAANQVAANQAAADQVAADQATADQVAADQATADQAAADQADKDQATADQADKDQATADQAAADQADKE